MLIRYISDHYVDVKIMNILYRWKIMFDVEIIVVMVFIVFSKVLQLLFVLKDVECTDKSFYRPLVT
jgi:hypothetical protein